MVRTQIPNKTRAELLSCRSAVPAAGGDTAEHSAMITPTRRRSRRGFRTMAAIKALLIAVLLEVLAATLRGAPTAYIGTPFLTNDLRKE